MAKLNGIPDAPIPPAGPPEAVLVSASDPTEPVAMASPQSSAVLEFARGLRLPTLFLITAGVLVVDVLLPDPIPFVDEVLLGLVTLMLASWKRRRVLRDAQAAPAGSEQVVADYAPGREGGASTANTPRTARPPLPDPGHRQ